MTVEVVALTEDLLARFAVDILGIEDSLLEAMGNLYSHERWGMTQFCHPLNEKWRLSSLAFMDGKVVGFWIASQPNAYVAHTHRVGVLPACQSAGVGRTMWGRVRDAMLASGARSATLTVRRENIAAANFYRRLGFLPVEGNDLLAFLADRGRQTAYRETFIIDLGLAYVVLRSDLSEMEKLS